MLLASVVTGSSRFCALLSLKLPLALKELSLKLINNNTHE
jgi:hypothetical protein